MTYFWSVAALLTAGGLLFLVPPLWGSERRERSLAIGVAVTFPLLVGAVYMAVGTPAALAPLGGDVKGAPHALNQQQVLAMVTRLAERMRSNPDDVDGWVMLGRSYVTIGRFSDAALAFERAVERLPNDSRLLADAADIVAMAQGRRLAGRPEELVERALAADSRNLKALSLSGTAAFEKGDYERAIEQWRKIIALVPAGSDAERSVRGSIADAERQMGKARGAPAQSAGIPRKP